MSQSGIVNCKRCNKIFKKMVSEICPTCVEKENEQFQKMFRLLQSSQPHGGILIEDLSEQVGIPIEVIEEYYFEAKLGTAGLFLKFKCRACSEVLDENNRKGRYCIPCSNAVSNKAGVKVRSLQDIEREERRAKDIIQLPSGKQNVEQPVESPLPRRAGFLRNR